MKYKFGIPIIVLLLLGQAAAQQELIPDTRRSYLSTGFGYQMYRFGGYTNTISQASFPLSLLLPIGRRFNLTIVHTPAVSRWEEGQGIDGLSDTWVLGTYIFWQDKAMINVGIGVPTGKTKLDNDQFQLSMFLSRNALRFQLPIYGQGFCIKSGFAVVYPAAEYVVVGVGAHYLHRRPYNPVLYDKVEVGTTSLIEYKPGDEFIGQVGVEFQALDNMKFILDGVYTYYGRDLWGDTEVYRSGQKVSMNFGFLFRMDKNYIWSQMTYRHKGKIEEYRGLDLEKETQNSNGFQIDLDIVCKVMDLEGSGILILGDGRFYGENEKDTRGKATIWGLGFGADAKLSDRIRLDFRFKYIAGNYTFTEERNVEGMDTFLGFTFRL